MDIASQSARAMLWFLAPPLLYCIAWVIYTRTIHPLHKVPGPWLASVSRAWIMYHTWRGDMEHVQRALHKKYGLLIRIAPNECACSDPQAIRDIYRTQGPLTKSDFYHIWTGGMSKYPDHFAVVDEKLHSQRRRTVNHVYSLSNILQSERHIDDCIKVIMSKFNELADGSKQVDIGEWMQWYAFDVIGELYFGKMFGFMQNSHDHGNYIESLDNLLPPMVVAAVGPSYLRGFILTGLPLVSARAKKAMSAIGHISTAAKDCVGRRIRGEDDVERRDILNQLLDIVANKGEKDDFQVPEVEQEAYSGLFAGSDTTAIALRSVLYYLMKHPAAYRKLQAELDQATEQCTLGPIVQYNEAIKLPYLCACIKEAMRLHPSVGLTMPRIAPAGGLNLGGYVVPEGYNVGMNAAVVHRDPHVFGPDPDAFRPERWLTGGGETDEKTSGLMGRSLLYFGAGTRTCIGKNISLSELHKLIPQILREFDMRLVQPDFVWETSNCWFNKQKRIFVTMEKRDR